MKKIKFDEKEFEEFKRRNFEERLRFIDIWVNYIKTHSNGVWSKQQKDVIDSAIKGWGE